MMPIEEFYFDFFNSQELYLKIKSQNGGLCQGDNFKIMNKFFHKGDKIYEKYKFIETENKGVFKLTGVGDELEHFEYEVTELLLENVHNINLFISNDTGDSDKPIYKKYIFVDKNKEPNLKTCEKTELMVYFYKKYLEKKGEYSKEKIYEFIDLEFSKKEEILKNEVYKNFIAEIKKEVIIPVDKPLTVEQMGLLEATIYATFTIGKIIFR